MPCLTFSSLILLIATYPYKCYTPKLVKRYNYQEKINHVG